MSVAFATRKLWLRRWNRVWSQLGWMLTFPFRQWQEALVLTVLAVLVGGFAFALFRIATNHNPASVEEITEYSAKNECLRNSIEIYLAKYQKPVTKQGLRFMEDGCDEQAEDEAALKKQMQTIKKQTRVISGE